MSLEKLNLNQLLGSEPMYDPIAHARMKVDAMNSIDGTLTGYDCPKCKNRGYTAILRNDGSFFTRECDCTAIRRCLSEMEKSGLKNIIKEKTFQAYQAAEGWQKSIKDGAMAYANDPKGWLLFCGQPGSGKTHLCVAVCRELLLNGREVRFMPWREKVSEIKGYSLDSEERGKILHELKTAQVLYIDDLFKVGSASNPTEADIAIAFEILNYRYNNHLATIISTEKLPEELAAIDEATGTRIVEKSKPNVYTIGRDMRRNYRMQGITVV